METSISDPDLHSVYWYFGKEAARMDLRYGAQDTPQSAALAVVLHVSTWNLQGMAWWAGYLSRINQR